MNLRNVGVILVMALLAIAAAAPPRVPIVTITKTDGTTVRGQLGTADLKAVSVTLLVKGKPEGGPETVNWADIKSVSNGITRQKVIDQWKKEHPDDRCADCRGDGKSACTVCKGTGRDSAAAKGCTTCKGEQTIACNTPKCDQGKVACPKMHIRLDQGNWYTKDGKKWRKFQSPDGNVEISDSHAGEVFDPKTGTAGACQICAGKLIIEDEKCRGSGVRPCHTCMQAALNEKCAQCERGKVACKTCNGAGLKLELLTNPS